jgi:kynurenine formamidase
VGNGRPILSPPGGPVRATERRNGFIRPGGASRPALLPRRAGVPLDLFYGAAVCLDISDFQPRTDITADDLDRVEAASPVDVRPGDIVLFYTATWNRFAGDKRYLSEFAGLGESGSEWIVWRRVKTFGVDSPTPDNPASTSYPCHMMCRREHITHYENLAHLDQVVNTRFTFAGFPLKLRGAHGGPARAVALVG